MMLPMAHGWNVLYNYSDNSPPYSIDDGRDILLDGTLLFVTSTTDDGFTIFNTTPTTIYPVTPIGSVNDSNTFGTLDGAVGIVKYQNLVYVAAAVDSSLSVYNVTVPSAPIAVVTYTDVSAPCSLSSIYKLALENTSDGNVYIHYAGTTGQYGILNATATLTGGNLTCLDDNVATANPCSMDAGRDIEINPVDKIAYGSSNADDTLSVFNFTNRSAITCITNITNSAPPYSLDQWNFFSLSSDYNLLYAASDLDSEVSIYNLSNRTKPVPIANLSITTGVQAMKSAIAYNNKIMYVATRAATTTWWMFSEYNVSTNTTISLISNYSLMSTALAARNYSRDFIASNHTLYGIVDVNDAILILNTTDHYPASSPPPATLCVNATDCSIDCASAGTISAIIYSPLNIITFTGTGTVTIDANVTANRFIKALSCRIANRANDNKMLITVNG